MGVRSVFHYQEPRSFVKSQCPGCATLPWLLRPDPSRVGPTRRSNLGRSVRRCPRLAVHVPPDGIMAVWAAEIGAAIRCSWRETGPSKGDGGPAPPQPGAVVAPPGFFRRWHGPCRILAPSLRLSPSARERLLVQDWARIARDRATASHGDRPTIPLASRNPPVPSGGRRARRLLGPEPVLPSLQASRPYHAEAVPDARKNRLTGRKSRQETAERPPYHSQEQGGRPGRAESEGRSAWTRV
jgi:hypothetical protein